jgi:hypothetical protein
VRLSEDDGPPAHLFLEDGEEQDNEVGDGDGIGHIGGDEHLPSPVELQSVGITRVDAIGHEDVPPAPPPKDLT